MSALATLMRAYGHEVSGSDRSHDRGESPEKFDALAYAGIELFPQDGSGVHGELEAVIVSSAVEKSIPDVKAALDQDIAVRKRAYLLAQLFNAGKGIGIAGTSGKTTVTAMAGHIMAEAGRQPTIVNGGVMLNDYDGKTATGNAVVGKEDGWFVVEMDESDGSIELFDPEIAVLNNITLDHKPLDELRKLFSDFVKRAEKGIVMNLDDSESATLFEKLSDSYREKIVTVQLGGKDADLIARNIKFVPEGASLEIYHSASDMSAEAKLLCTGRHNISNALCAVAAAIWAGVPFAEAVATLETFAGTKRRLQVLGQNKGVTVIDDFAHNPDKIAASLGALREFDGRLLVMFQPHGFAPTKLMEKELVESFAEGLGADDILLMPEIYYAGGTVERSISSKDITDAVQAAGKTAIFCDTRNDAAAYMVSHAQEGDRIVIMGARDDTLTQFAMQILSDIPARKVA